MRIVRVGRSLAAGTAVVAIVSIASCSAPYGVRGGFTAAGYERDKPLPFVTAFLAAQAQEQAAAMDERCAQQFAAPPSPPLADKAGLLKKLSGIGIAKSDFETTDAYYARLAQELAAQGIDASSPIFISWTLDPDYVRYNADIQAMKVKEYAVSNMSADASRLFGFGSALAMADIEVKYSVLENIDLSFWHKEKVTGSYAGQTALGASAEVVEITHDVAGVFDRAAARDEDIWSANNSGSDPNRWGENDLGADAFYMPAPPDLARRVRDTGSVVLMMTLKWPYYAEGTKRYSPKITVPTDRTYVYRYIIADMQCLALTTPEDGVVAVRSLR